MLIDTNLPYTFNPFARPSTANSSYISFDQLLSYIRGDGWAWNLALIHDQRLTPLNDTYPIFHNKPIRRATSKQLS